MKQYIEGDYEIIEYPNGSIVKSVIGTPTEGVTIKLPPSLDERMVGIESIIFDAIIEGKL